MENELSTFEGQYNESARRLEKADPVNLLVDVTIKLGIELFKIAREKPTSLDADNSLFCLLDADGRRLVCEDFEAVLSSTQIPDSAKALVRAELGRVVAQIDQNPEGFRQVEDLKCRGWREIKEGEFSKARSTFLELYCLVPEDVKVLLYLSFCESFLGDYDSEINFLKASLELCKTYDAYVRLMHAQSQKYRLFEDKQSSGAQEMLLNIRSLMDFINNALSRGSCPSSLQTYLCLTETLMNIEDYEGVDSLLSRCTELAQTENADEAVVASIEYLQGMVMALSGKDCRLGMWLARRSAAEVISERPNLKGVFKREFRESLVGAFGSMPIRELFE